MLVKDLKPGMCFIDYYTNMSGAESRWIELIISISLPYQGNDARDILYDIVVLQTETYNGIQESSHLFPAQRKSSNNSVYVGWTQL